MVWDGTTERLLLRNGLYIEFTKFDANGEVSDVIDLGDVEDGGGFAPLYWSWMVRRTSGATDVVSVKLEYTYDNHNWATADTCTNSNGSDGAVHTVDYTSATGVPVRVARWWRVTCTTVGAGNVLEAHVTWAY